MSASTSRAFDIDEDCRLAAFFLNCDELLSLRLFKNVVRIDDDCCCKCEYLLERRSSDLERPTSGTASESLVVLGGGGGSWDVGREFVLWLAARRAAAVAGRRSRLSTLYATSDARDRELSSRRSGTINDERNDLGRDCDLDAALFLRGSSTLTVTDDLVNGGSDAAVVIRCWTAYGLEDSVPHRSRSTASHFDDLKAAHSEWRHEHRPDLSLLPAAVSSVAVARLLRRFNCLMVMRPRVCCPAAAAAAAGTDTVEPDDGALVVSCRRCRYSRVSDAARRLSGGVCVEDVSAVAACRLDGGTLRTAATATP